MQTQARGSSVSWSQIKEKYPPDEFIHVLPAEDSIFGHSSPQWRLDVTLLKFDPNSEKEVYPIERKNRKNDRNEWESEVVSVGLTKASLERLCSAAGVSIVGPTGSGNGRVDDGRDPLFCEFVFFGVISTKGGEIRTQPASKTWNGHLRREVKLREAEKRFETLTAKDWAVDVPGVGRKKARACDDAEREKVIEGWFKDEWLREREYGPATAESKAQNRARRAILGLSAKYTFAEIQTKTFVIARWMFEPDLSDPEIKRLVVKEGLAAQRRAFLLPPAAPSQAVQLPAHEPTRAALPPGPPEGEVERRLIEDAVDEAAEAEAEEALERGPQEVEEVEVEQSAPVEEDDTVDEIPDDELSFTVAKMMFTYTGPKKEALKKRWEKASAIRNPHGFRDLREIIRFMQANS